MKLIVFFLRTAKDKEYKAKNFHRIKNKEQGREKQKVNEEQGSEHGAQVWLGLWGPADWIHCIAGEVERF